MPQLRPQDLLLARKLAVLPEVPSLAELGSSLGLSASPCHAALKPAATCGLVDGKSRRVRQGALLEFLIHGAKYVFPSLRGPRTRGFPTAHSAPRVDASIHGGEDACVWPDPEGELRGEAPDLEAPIEAQHLVRDAPRVPVEDRHLDPKALGAIAARAALAARHRSRASTTRHGRRPDPARPRRGAGGHPASRGEGESGSAGRRKLRVDRRRAFGTRCSAIEAYPCERRGIEDLGLVSYRGSLSARRSKRRSARSARAPSRARRRAGTRPRPAGTSRRRPPSTARSGSPRPSGSGSRRGARPAPSR